MKVRRGLLAGALLAAGAAPMSAHAATHGVACVWNTMPAEVKNDLAAAFDNPDTTDAQFEAVRLSMVPFLEACVAPEGWDRQEQLRLSFEHALLASAFEGDGTELRELGIDPAEVAALLPAIPAEVVELMEKTGGLTEEELDDVGIYLAFFLAETGPARQPPGRGLAGNYLISLAKLQGIERRYAALD